MPAIEEAQYITLHPYVVAFDHQTRSGQAALPVYVHQ